MRRVVTYLRVSTREQTVEAQRTGVTEYLAQRKDLTVVREFVETRSGAKFRPVFEEMLTAARQRKFDVLVVARIDRCGRTVVGLAMMLDELRSLGIDFVSTAEGYDTSTPGGRALFGMAAVFAELERSLIRDRVLDGMEAAKQRGVTFGRPAKARSMLTAELMIEARAKYGSITKACRALGVAESSFDRSWRRCGLPVPTTEERRDASTRGPR